MRRRSLSVCWNQDKLTSFGWSKILGFFDNFIFEGNKGLKRDIVVVSKKKCRGVIDWGWGRDDDVITVPAGHASS